VDREAMLKKVQMHFFAAYDARLFLDTHPTDLTALDYFKTHVALGNSAKKEYEAKFGPLEAENVGNSWNWVDDPWPWENLGRYA
jgi:spore coat protein JB